MQHAFNERRFVHRGAQLALEVSGEGEGPFAVYAHGGFVSRAVEDRMGLFDWRPVLDAGRRLVRYDARGHGRSTGGAVDGDYTYASLAGDLLALLDHLGPVEPVAAMGASMGCGTVLHAATRASDRFSRLVLLLPPTAWDTRTAYARNNLRSAERIAHEGAEAWAAERRRRKGPAVVADVPAFPPTPVDAVLPSVLRGLAQTDLPAPGAIASLLQPVLILTWADDPGHPLSTAETLHHLLPHSELHVSRTRKDVRTWGQRIATYLTAGPA
ncbi:alpha/beta fold hydrolase [Streptomyces sp. NPDC058864]